MTAKYGGQHQAIRRANLPYAYGTPCCRCGQTMRPGERLELDHDDDGAAYRGFAHARCNRVAGGLLGRSRQLERKRKTMSQLTKAAVGVEIAEARDHCSIVAAGAVDDGCVLIELTDYLDGTDGVAAVLALRETRTVVAIVIDPHSPAGTLIRPLADAGVVVTEPSTSDVGVAFGLFCDELKAGRLRHGSQPELTAAVRHGTQRRLGGASAWERRGAPVDVSPLNAATLAVWGWHRRPPELIPMAAWA